MVLLLVLNEKSYGLVAWRLLNSLRKIEYLLIIVLKCVVRFLARSLPRTSSLLKAMKDSAAASPVASDFGAEIGPAV